MIRMLSVKLGKQDNEKISEILSYRLKKEAKAKREADLNSGSMSMLDFNLLNIMDNRLVHRDILKKDKEILLF